VQYRSWESSSKDSVTATRRDLVDFSSDAFYVAPITELALLHASVSSSSSSSTSSSSSSLSSPPSVAGTFFFVVNSSESDDLLAHSLGALLTDGVDPFSTDVVYSSADKLLSEVVLAYWIGFIATGCAAAVVSLYTCPFGVVVASFVSHQRSYSTSSPVSIGMGDRLSAGMWRARTGVLPCR